MSTTNDSTIMKTKDKTAIIINPELSFSLLDEKNHLKVVGFDDNQLNSAVSFSFFEENIFAILPTAFDTAETTPPPELELLSAIFFISNFLYNFPNYCPTCLILYFFSNLID